MNTRGNLDGGLPSPRTAIVKPGGRGYTATCRSCWHVDDELTRNAVIAAHNDHVRDAHAEAKTA